MLCHQHLARPVRPHLTGSDTWLGAVYVTQSSINCIFYLERSNAVCEELCGLLQIFYLNREKQPLLPKHIDGLPALYLDCDTDIDLDRDQAAKDAFARQIEDFYEHVSRLRAAR